MIIKVIGIGLVCVVLNVVLKQYKPEFAFLVNACCGLVMFMLLSSGLDGIVNNFVYIQNSTNTTFNIVSPILKVIGIGYITEFAADMADDCGNKSIADKIILGGKVAICLLAIPTIKSLINAIVSLI